MHATLLYIVLLAKLRTLDTRSFSTLALSSSGSFVLYLFRSFIYLSVLSIIAVSIIQI